MFDEDYSAFFRSHNEELQANIKVGSKCVYIDKPLFGNDLAAYAKKSATIIKLVLTRFADDAPPIIPVATLLKISKGADIIDTANLEGIANLHQVRQQPYKVRTTVSRQNVSEYYKLVKKVCDGNPFALFTLNKFNSSLTRSDPYDKIVDVTIGLESLISGNADLRFKFALYHSFTAESEADKRASAFNLFGNLYDVRSAIVHGDLSKERLKSIDKLEENWDEVMRLATSSLNYYLFYLYQKSRPEWDVHLKNIVLGSECRIT